MKRAARVIQVTALAAVIGAVGCGQGAGGSAATESNPSPAATQGRVAVQNSAIVDAAHAGWVHVPGGHLMHPSCVHRVPSGASVDANNDVYVKGKLYMHIDDCAYKSVDTRKLTVAPRLEESDHTPGIGGSGPRVPGLNGWVASSNAAISTFILSFENTGETGWTVPPAPTTPDDGQVIFFFNSVTPSDNGWILQPVLQFGVATGVTDVQGGSFGDQSIGGAYWQLASWAVSAGGVNAIVSEPVTVNVGDDIYGSGALFDYGSSAGTGDWTIYGIDNTTGGESALTVSMGETFTNMQAGVLEVYGVNTCADLPNAAYTFFAKPAFESASNTSAASVTYDGHTMPSWWKSYIQNQVTQYTGSWTATTDVSSNALGSGCTFGSAIISGSGGTSLEY